MRQSIQKFNLQFSFNPKITHAEGLPKKKKEKIVVVGMGGSHLAADLLKDFYPEAVIIHSDYNLPRLTKKDANNSLFIFSSYSGNTEEILSGFKLAISKKLSVAAIASGGKLLALAAKNKIPYVQLPESNVQPRMAVGYSLMALLKVTDKNKDFQSCQKLTQSLRPLSLEKKGRQLAKKIKGCIPIIYSSNKNYGVALNWKIRFNETGKIPAFFNILPELNHNEMIAPSDSFYYLFLDDSKDPPKIQKRSDVLKKIYRRSHLKVSELPMKESDPWKKVFNSLILADWTAYYLAISANKEPEKTEMIEEFKKMIVK